MGFLVIKILFLIYFSTWNQYKICNVFWRLWNRVRTVFDGSVGFKTHLPYGHPPLKREVFRADGLELMDITVMTFFHVT